MQIYTKRLPVAEYGTHHYPGVPSDHGILGDQINILRVGVDTRRMMEDDELFKDVVQYWTVHVWEPLKQRFPSCSLCLFATHFLSTTTPTRLDRYWRLWKRLKRNHPELIDLEETFEREFSENQKIRYAGISILKEADFQNALDYGVKFGHERNSPINNLGLASRISLTTFRIITMHPLFHYYQQ